MSVKYKIIKKSENPFETIIEKSDFSIRFNLSEIETAIFQNEKLKKEIEAKKEIEEAKITNVLRNYPEVEKMDEKLLIACYLYYESKSFLKTAKEKLAEIEKKNEAGRKELAEIYQQTKLCIIRIDKPKKDEKK